MRDIFCEKCGSERVVVSWYLGVIHCQICAHLADLADYLNKDLNTENMPSVSDEK